MGVLLGSFLVGPLTEVCARLTRYNLLAIMSACYGCQWFISMLWAVCLLVLAGIVLPSFNSSIIAYINARHPEHDPVEVHSVQGIEHGATPPPAVLLAGFLIDEGYYVRRCSTPDLFPNQLVVMVFQAATSSRISRR